MILEPANTLTHFMSNGWSGKLVLTFFFCPTAHSAGQMMLMREGIQLPCKTRIQLLEGDVVEWRFSKRAPKVVYRHVIGRDEPGFAQESYRMPNLQKTELTLTLRNPYCRHSGIYTCTVHRGGSTLAQAVVEVLVKGQPFSFTITSL